MAPKRNLLITLHLPGQSLNLMESAWLITCVVASSSLGSPHRVLTGFLIPLLRLISLIAKQKEEEEETYAI